MSGRPNKPLSRGDGQLRINHKVLHVTPFLPPEKGGIADHVANICMNLSRQGNDIYTASPKHIRSEFENSLKSFRFPSIYLLGWPYHTLRSISIPVDLGLSLDSIIRKGNFDVIHVHGHHYPLSWIAINSARKHHVASVLTMHGMYALNPNVMGGETKIENILNKYLFQRILSNTTAIIGLTRQITEYARSVAGESVRYYTIPNGVDTLMFSKNLSRKEEYRLKYNIDKKKQVILFTGRLENVKGILEFAGAAKNIMSHPRTNVEFVIVGEGTLVNKVKVLLDRIPNIQILPWQPLDQLVELYIAADIFVIPSKFEALPITVIEAMNAGLHVVYTPVGGLPDILQGYSNKTLLSSGSVEEIHSALVKLIESPSQWPDNESMVYARQFDWKIAASRISGLYSEIAGETRLRQNGSME